MPAMNTYLVGGAVRDQLLGRPVHERDHVVVGATPEDMLRLGYQQVGRDFPVFLHPQTREEYALARVERKQGHGYHGFVVHAAADVTLEDDLRRRDLTINAMALADDGTLIDPWGGRRDLEARLLRHVSPAFADDPLRVLRVARFAARYASLGFVIAEETRTLMAQMSASGELDHLTPERVWMETARALTDPAPAVYFSVLREVGALARLFPEIDRLWGVPNPPLWHPEIDSGVHTLMVLRQACELSPTLPVRFAALVHDLGKGVTPAAQWPSHRGHEEGGVPIIEALCARLKIANDCRDLGVLVSRFHLNIHRGLTLRPGTVVRVLQQADAFRRPERFADVLLACEADYRGRTGWEERAYPQRAFWNGALKLARNVAVQPLLARGLKGEELAERIFEKRAEAVAEWRAKLAHDSTELA